MESDQLLRLYVADPNKDLNGNEIEPFFSNVEIDNLLERFEDDMYGAAAEAWRIKAGRAVELVNSTTDNSTFSLSDIHKHCMNMVEHYSDISGSVGGATLSNIRLDSQPDFMDDEGDEIVVA
jgi:hypothetical protein